MVVRKKPIGDTVNHRKILQEDTVIDPEKGRQHKRYRNFRYKEYYEGYRNERNPYTDDSQTGNDDCVRKLDTEQENEND